MNVLKALIVLATALLPAVSGADDAPAVPTTAAQLAQDPKGSDGKLFDVTGYYLADLMRVPHLYASRADALADKEFDAIDLIFTDEGLKATLRSPDPGCLVVRGRFSTYDHGQVLTGLTSKYGVLYVQDVERCPGK